MELKEPFLMILVGPTLSGKSTWIRNNFPEVNVISRDEIVMEVAKTRDYNKAFNEVDQKLVDKVLKERMESASQSKTSTIVDMTNLGSKRRRQTLLIFPSDFEKVAVIFPILETSEYFKRNELRNISENKFIPESVIKSMINSYEVPTTEEGFDRVLEANV